MSEQPLMCLAHKVPLPCRDCGGPLFVPQAEPVTADQRAQAISTLEEIARALDALNYKPTASHMRQSIEILKGAPCSTLAFAATK